MIQSASLSPSALKTAAPHRERAGNGRFAQSLAAFLDADEGETPDPKVADQRKVAAPPGNPLPDEDRRDDTALAWLMTIAPPPVPAPAPPAAGVAGGPVTPTLVDGNTAGASTPSAPSDVGGRVLPVGFDIVQPERKVVGLMTAGLGSIPATIDETSKNPAGITFIRDPVSDAKRLGRIAADVPAPPTPAVPAAPVTAAQVFGAAMREAARDDKHVRADPDLAPLAPPPAQVEAQRHAVAATGEAQQAPLDMGHDRWPHRMIERIESMRDAADAADTRIRLVPDALGTIDVSMRRDGDAVHVQFAAEQAATRALLTDAQPRLAELAASRGIKLGGSAVDSGGADARQNRPPMPAPLPQAPARVAATPTSTDDARIA